MQAGGDRGCSRNHAEEQESNPWFGWGCSVMRDSPGNNPAAAHQPQFQTVLCSHWKSSSPLQRDQTQPSAPSLNFSLNKARAQEIHFVAKENLKVHLVRTPYLRSLNCMRCLFTSYLRSLSQLREKETLIFLPEALWLCAAEQPPRHGSTMPIATREEDRGDHSSNRAREGAMCPAPAEVRKQMGPQRAVILSHPFTFWRRFIKPQAPAKPVSNLHHPCLSSCSIPCCSPLHTMLESTGSKKSTSEGRCCTGYCGSGPSGHQPSAAHITPASTVLASRQRLPAVQPWEEIILSPPTPTERREKPG